MGKNIREKFNEKVVKSIHVFCLVDALLEKIAYGLLPFKTLCHWFYWWRGSKTAAKCDFCTRFFIHDNDLGAELDREFVLTKKNFEKLPICSLMDQVKTRSVALNLYYSVGDYARNDIMRTENFGEIFFEISNNPFGVYIVYLQIYFRVFFNFLKSVTEVLIDNYLFEHACKETVSKIKKNQ